jgi:prevent-host-death family protein
MNITQDIKPISYVKTHAADILDQINETHRPMIVTQNGEVKAVIVDPATYQERETAFKLLKLLAQSEKDIQDGNRIPQKTVFKRMEAKFK